MYLAIFNDNGRERVLAQGSLQHVLAVQKDFDVRSLIVHASVKPYLVL